MIIEMNITYSIKQLGKKHPIISNKSIQIEDIGSSVPLRVLLTAVIQQQVGLYNTKEPEKSIINYLMPDEVEEQSKTGKVGFSIIYNENKVDPETAVKNALQAFEDGIYCVFIDDQQIDKLDDILNILPESVFSFIRLSFLAGSYW
jgi:hypothetical protein